MVGHFSKLMGLMLVSPFLLIVGLMYLVSYLEPKPQGDKESPLAPLWSISV